MDTTEIFEPRFASQVMDGPQLLHGVCHASVGQSLSSSTGSKPVPQAVRHELFAWTSNLLFATHDSHHARGFQQKTRSANPLDLSRLAVDLKSHNLAY
eukprot:193155-Pelagomonas_calceolata.AAC.2